MEIKAVLFTNWSDEDFSHRWDGQVFTFKKGQSMMLQDYLANHFAKHLAEREMEKANVPPLTRRSTIGQYIAKCFKGEESEQINAQSDVELETKILNANAEAQNTCTVCGKFFKTETGLKTHMTRMHYETSNTAGSSNS